MKDSCVLINLGRGDSIDEHALAVALNTGQIAGAAIDVQKKEPLPAESELWDA
jgi:phosphoglycerate dehydrogenase-like enzyme